MAHMVRMQKSIGNNSSTAMNGKVHGPAKSKDLLPTAMALKPTVEQLKQSEIFRAQRATLVITHFGGDEENVGIRLAS